MKQKILGLDLGVTSVGWSVLEADEGKQAFNLVDVGARVFEAGLDGDIEGGKGESPCAERRECRGARRNLKRRRMRKRALAHLLQRQGLLPADKPLSQAIQEIDAGELSRLLREQPKDMPPVKHLPQVLPYYLRAQALECALPPYLLGRAIYHLAQRRGFFSNSRLQASLDEDEEEESGKVKKGISELRKNMKAAHARTLGEYFCRQNPSERKIRRLWTDRAMFLDEFEQICRAQKIAPELKKALHCAIFFQRPLRSAKHLIGKCSLEPYQRRAPMYHPDVERFTMLQTINHLRVVNAVLKEVSKEEAKKLKEDLKREKNVYSERKKKLEKEYGNNKKHLKRMLEIEKTFFKSQCNYLRGLTYCEHPLSPEEREKLIEALCGEGDLLEKSGKLSISKAKTILNLGKDDYFSLEKGGETHLPGCFFEWKMRGIFQDQWGAFSAKEKEAILQDFRSIQKRELLRKRAQNCWNLNEADARVFADLPLKDGYASLSLKAIRKLLPDMEAGMDYSDARKKHYPQSFKSGQPQETLPPVASFLSDLRNPLVNRVLTQLRRVVNAVIAKHGKPDIVRIELARDLKNSAKERERISENARKHEEARAAAHALILEEIPNSKPTRRDLLKIRLWEECEHRCPYTGKVIGFAELLSGEYDIEHIIPFSRSLDDSFQNKTLCHAEENRNVKQNKTPYEAYSANPQKYEEILQRVRRFKNSEKLERFELSENAKIDEMSSRLLNDTRYASRLAMEYVGALFGGAIDAQGRRRVQACAGAATALLRKEFGLNDILGNGEKTRDDHRHHAVDAVALALASPAQVKRLTDLFKQLGPKDRQRLFKEAWLKTGSEAFLQAVKEKVNAVLASHHAPSRIRGALHKKTLYGPDRKEDGTISESPSGIKHQRKELGGLSKKELFGEPGEKEFIVDPIIRKIVRDAFNASGKRDINQCFIKTNPESFPKDPQGNSIRTVSVRCIENTTPIGSDNTRRHVMLASNHHVEIVAVLDMDGHEIEWEGHIVSQLVAHRRKRVGEPIIQRAWGADEKGRERKFKFSLTQKDVVRFKAKKEYRDEYFVVRSIDTSGTIAFVRLNDARKKEEIKAAGQWVRSNLDPLRLKSCEKFKMTALGELRRAHD